MDWVLEHLRLIIAIAGGVAWWMNQLKRKPAVTRAGDKSFADPELAARTRRIREELQRKIEQRAQNEPGGGPGLSLQGRGAAGIKSDAEKSARAATARLDAMRAAETQAQQGKLQAQLQVAEAMQAAALAGELNRMSAVAKVAGNTGLRGALAEDLRTPDALRRAFVLREIIGPPVALRS